MAFFYCCGYGDLNLRICDEQGKAAEANHLLPQVVHFVMGSNSKRRLIFYLDDLLLSKKKLFFTLLCSLEIEKKLAEKPFELLCLFA